MPRKKNDNPLTVDEKEKLKIMIANGKSYNAVGRELKRDPKTVKKYALEPEIKRDITEKQRDLAEFYGDLAKRMLASISDQDIERINAYQRTVSAGIATDKRRLLTRPNNRERGCNCECNRRSQEKAQGARISCPKRNMTAETPSNLVSTTLTPTSMQNIKTRIIEDCQLK